MFGSSERLRHHPPDLSLACPSLACPSLGRAPLARPSLSHQGDTTDNSPFATISPSTHTVPSMYAIRPTSVSFLVSMRSPCPGVTALRNLKWFTAPSSATPPAVFSPACGAADPSITPAV